jgi:hypothetical protein
MTERLLLLLCCTLLSTVARRWHGKTFSQLPMDKKQELYSYPVSCIIVKTVAPQPPVTSVSTGNARVQADPDAPLILPSALAV